MIKLNYFLLLLIFVASSCSEKRSFSKPINEKPDLRFPECPDCALSEKLYYLADTTIERNDSVIVINTRLDTTVVETGIFVYLQTSYPVVTPDKLVFLIKQAVLAEKAHDSIKANLLYGDAVKFYREDWLKRKTGFDNDGISDLNEYFAANVNVAILASYAFERLKKLPEATYALAPYLANVEASTSKIQLRYVQLCIKRYGKAVTRKALNTSGKTVHHTQSGDEYSDWTVTVFGVNLGVDFNSDLYATDSLSQQEAQRFIWEQPFWALVK